jgi:hypothetical protein
LAVAVLVASAFWLVGVFERFSFVVNLIYSFSSRFLVATSLCLLMDI